MEERKAGGLSEAIIKLRIAVKELAEEVHVAREKIDDLMKVTNSPRPGPVIGQVGMHKASPDSR